MSTRQNKAPIAERPTGEEQYFLFSPLPILRFNHDCVMLQSNDAFEGLTGYSSGEMTKLNDKSLNKILPYDCERVKNAVREICSGAKTFSRNGEIKLLSKDETEKIVNITLYAASADGAGAAEMIIQDITELKQLKDRINAVNRIKLLQDITRGFLHSVSNTINSIMSKTQLALSQTTDETLKREISQIEECAISIGTQVRRIRNSIGHKGYFYEERTEQIHSIINDAIEFSKMQFKVELKEKRRKISVTAIDENGEPLGSRTSIRSKPAASEIKTDTGLFREILISLILKVSDCIEKKGTISVSVKETKDDDALISVSAEKDESDTQAQRLQQFVNVFSGLNIRQSAEKLGFKIFEEETNDTYCGKIIIPKRLILNKTEQKDSESFVKPSELNIIIVEPDNALRKILSDIFENLGNKTTVFTDGVEALEYFKENNSDILITDYDITGITGIELAARAKECRESSITVIMSGWASEDMWAYTNVVDLIMTKPFTLDKLLKKLSYVIEGKKAANR